MRTREDAQYMQPTSGKSPNGGKGVSERNVTTDMYWFRASKAAFRERFLYVF